MHFPAGFQAVFDVEAVDVARALLPVFNS